MVIETIQWHAVKDGPPPELEELLLQIGSRVLTGVYYDGQYLSEKDPGIMHCIAWAELPKGIISG